MKKKKYLPAVLLLSLFILNFLALAQEDSPNQELDYQQEFLNNPTADRLLALGDSATIANFQKLVEHNPEQAAAYLEQKYNNEFAQKFYDSPDHLGLNPDLDDKYISGEGNKEQSTQNIEHNVEVAATYFTGKFGKDVKIENVPAGFFFNKDKNSLILGQSEYPISTYSNIVGVRVTETDVILIPAGTERIGEISTTGGREGKFTYQEGNLIFTDTLGTEQKFSIIGPASTRFNFQSDGTLEVKGPVKGTVWTDSNNYVDFTNRVGTLVIKPNGDLKTENAEVLTRQIYADGKFAKEGDLITAQDHGDHDRNNIDSDGRTVIVDRTSRVGVKTQGQNGENNVKIHLDDLPDNSDAAKPEPQTLEEAKEAARNIRQAQGDLEDNAEVWIQKDEGKISVVAKGKVEVGFYDVGPNGGISSGIPKPEPHFVGHNGKSELELQLGSKTQISLLGKADYSDAEYSTAGGEKFGIQTVQDGASLKITRDAGSKGDIIHANCFDCERGIHAIRIQKSLKIGEAHDIPGIISQAETHSLNIVIKVDENGKLGYFPADDTRGTLGKLAKAQTEGQRVAIGRDIKIGFPCGDKECTVELKNERGSGTAQAFYEEYDGKTTRTVPIDTGYGAILGEEKVIISEKDKKNLDTLLHLIKTKQTQSIPGAKLEFSDNPALRKFIKDTFGYDTTKISNPQHIQGVEDHARYLALAQDGFDKLNTEFGIKPEDKEKLDAILARKRGREFDVYTKILENLARAELANIKTKSENCRGDAHCSLSQAQLTEHREKVKRNLISIVNQREAAYREFKRQEQEYFKNHPPEGTENAQAQAVQLGKDIKENQQDRLRIEATLRGTKETPGAEARTATAKQRYDQLLAEHRQKVEGQRLFAEQSIGFGEVPVVSSEEQESSEFRAARDEYFKERDLVNTLKKNLLNTQNRDSDARGELEYLSADFADRDDVVANLYFAAGLYSEANEFVDDNPYLSDQSRQELLQSFEGHTEAQALERSEFLAALGTDQHIAQAGTILNSLREQQPGIVASPQFQKAQDAHNQAVIARDQEQQQGLDEQTARHQKQTTERRAGIFTGPEDYKRPQSILGDAVEIFSPPIALLRLAGVIPEDVDTVDYFGHVGGRLFEKGHEPTFDYLLPAFTSSYVTPVAPTLDLLVAAGVLQGDQVESLREYGAYSREKTEQEDRTMVSLLAQREYAQKRNQVMQAYADEGLDIRDALRDMETGNYDPRVLHKHRELEGPVVYKREGLRLPEGNTVVLRELANGRLPEETAEGREGLAAQALQRAENEEAIQGGKTAFVEHEFREVSNSYAGTLAASEADSKIQALEETTLGISERYHQTIVEPVGEGLASVDNIVTAPFDVLEVVKAANIAVKVYKAERALVTAGKFLVHGTEEAKVALRLARQEIRAAATAEDVAKLERLRAQYQSAAEAAQAAQQEARAAGRVADLGNQVKVSSYRREFAVEYKQAEQRLAQATADLEDAQRVGDAARAQTAQNAIIDSRQQLSQLADLDEAAKVADARPAAERVVGELPVSEKVRDAERTFAEAQGAYNRQVDALGEARVTPEAKERIRVANENLVAARAEDLSDASGVRVEVKGPSTVEQKIRDRLAVEGFADSEYAAAAKQKRAAESGVVPIREEQGVRSDLLSNAACGAAIYGLALDCGEEITRVSERIPAEVKVPPARVSGVRIRQPVETPAEWKNALQDPESIAKLRQETAPGKLATIGEADFVFRDRSGNVIEGTQTLRTSDFDGKPYFNIKVVDPRTQRNIAGHDYYIDTDPELGEVIKVGLTKVETPYRGAGVNTRLFQQMSDLHPNVKYIDTTLASDNYRVYSEALLAGDTPLDAIKKTPAYKVREAAGWELDLRHSNLPDLDTLTDPAKRGAREVELVVKRKESVVSDVVNRRAVGCAIYGLALECQTGAVSEIVEEVEEITIVGPGVPSARTVPGKREIPFVSTADQTHNLYVDVLQNHKGGKLPKEVVNQLKLSEGWVGQGAENIVVKVTDGDFLAPINARRRAAGKPELKASIDNPLILKIRNTDTPFGNSPEWLQKVHGDLCAAKAATCLEEVDLEAGLWQITEEAKGPDLEQLIENALTKAEKTEWDGLRQEFRNEVDQLTRNADEAKLAIRKKALDEGRELTDNEKIILAGIDDNVNRNIDNAQKASLSKTQQLLEKPYAEGRLDAVAFEGRTVDVRQKTEQLFAKLRDADTEVLDANYRNIKCIDAECTDLVVVDLGAATQGKYSTIANPGIAEDYARNALTGGNFDITPRVENLLEQNLETPGFELPCSVGALVGRAAQTSCVPPTSPAYQQVVAKEVTAIKRAHTRQRINVEAIQKNYPAIEVKKAEAAFTGKLGEGTTALVFEGSIPGVGENLAFKTAKTKAGELPLRGNLPENVGGLFRELENAPEACKFVVCPQYYGIFEIDGIPYLVTEKVEGKRLVDLTLDEMIQYGIEQKLEKFNTDIQRALEAGLQPGDLQDNVLVLTKQQRLGGEGDLVVIDVADWKVEKRGAGEVSSIVNGCAVAGGAIYGAACKIPEIVGVPEPRVSGVQLVPAPVSIDDIVRQSPELAQPELRQGLESIIDSGEYLDDAVRNAADDAARIRRQLGDDYNPDRYVEAVLSDIEQRRVTQDLIQFDDLAEQQRREGLLRLAVESNPNLHWDYEYHSLTSLVPDLRKKVQNVLRGAGSRATDYRSTDDFLFNLLDEVSKTNTEVRDAHQILRSQKQFTSLPQEEIARIENLFKSELEKALENPEVLQASAKIEDPALAQSLANNFATGEKGNYENVVKNLQDYRREGAGWAFRPEPVTTTFAEGKRVVRYRDVKHDFGKGRGNFVDGNNPFWSKRPGPVELTRRQQYQAILPEWTEGPGEEFRLSLGFDGPVGPLDHLDEYDGAIGAQISKTEDYYTGGFSQTYSEKQYGQAIDLILENNKDFFRARGLNPDVENPRKLLLKIARDEGEVSLSHKGGATIAVQKLPSEPGALSVRPTAVPLEGKLAPEITEVELPSCPIGGAIAGQAAARPCLPKAAPKSLANLEEGKSFRVKSKRGNSYGGRYLGTEGERVILQTGEKKRFFGLLGSKPETSTLRIGNLDESTLIREGEQIRILGNDGIPYAGKYAGEDADFFRIVYPDGETVRFRKSDLDLNTIIGEGEEITLKSKSGNTYSGEYVAESPGNIFLRDRKTGQTYGLNIERIDQSSIRSVAYQEQQTKKIIRDNRVLFADAEKFPSHQTKQRHARNVILEGESEPRQIIYSLTDRKVAEREGLIYENVPSSQLPPGQYTYVILEDGSIVFGKVSNDLEFGVKHVHLADGRKVKAAGEVSIDEAGNYAFNLRSGTFTSPIRDRKFEQFEHLGIAAAQEEVAKFDRALRTNMETVFTHYFGRSGAFTVFPVLPNKPSSLDELVDICVRSSGLNLPACGFEDVKILAEQRRGAGVSDAADACAVAGGAVYGLAACPVSAPIPLERRVEISPPEISGVREKVPTGQVDPLQLTVPGEDKWNDLVSIIKKHERESSLDQSDLEKLVNKNDPEFVGRGAEGVVRKVPEDVQVALGIDKPVVIKIRNYPPTKPGKLATEEIAHTFPEAAELLNSIKGKDVAPEAYKWGDNYYVVEELGGETVHEFIVRHLSQENKKLYQESKGAGQQLILREGFPPEAKEQLRPLIDELTDTLAEAGVVVDDFHPGNVKLVPTDEGLKAKVVDIGFAYTTDPESAKIIYEFKENELLKAGGQGVDASGLQAIRQNQRRSAQNALRFSDDFPPATDAIEAATPQQLERALREAGVKDEKAVSYILVPEGKRLDRIYEIGADPLDVAVKLEGGIPKHVGEGVFELGGKKYYRAADGTWKIKQEGLERLKFWVKTEIDDPEIIQELDIAELSKISEEKVAPIAKAQETGGISDVADACAIAGGAIYGAACRVPAPEVSGITIVTPYHAFEAAPFGVYDDLDQLKQRYPAIYEGSALFTSNFKYDRRLINVHGSHNNYLQGYETVTEENEVLRHLHQQFAAKGIPEPSLTNPGVDISKPAALAFHQEGKIYYRQFKNEEEIFNYALRYFGYNGKNLQEAKQIIAERQIKLVAGHETYHHAYRKLLTPAERGIWEFTVKQDPNFQNAAQGLQKLGYTEEDIIEELFTFRMEKHAFGETEFSEFGFIADDRELNVLKELGVLPEDFKRKTAAKFLPQEGVYKLGEKKYYRSADGNWQEKRNLWFDKEVDDPDIMQELYLEELNVISERKRAAQSAEEITIEDEETITGSVITGGAEAATT